MAITVAIRLLKQMAIIEDIEHKELMITNGFSIVSQNFFHIPK